MNTIILGNCIEKMKTIGSNSIDLILTDPPYGLLKHKIETDFDIDIFFEECYRILKNNSFLIYFGQQPSLSKWVIKSQEKGFNYKNEVIWYKGRGTSPFMDMNRMFENIMIMVKGKRKFNDIKLPFTDIAISLADMLNHNYITTHMSQINNMINDIDKIKELIKYENKDKSIYCQISKQNSFAIVPDGIKRKYRYLDSYNIVKNGLKPRNVLAFKPHNCKLYSKNDYNIKHPTVKQIDLCEYLIKICSNENDIVIDPFIGSGTTALACIKSNRKYIGIEIDDEYYKMCLDRIEKYGCQPECDSSEQLGLF